MIMLVDALRADFIWQRGSRFAFVNDKIAEGAALPFTTRAHPPTVTLPRIKSMITGSIPGFLDIKANLGSSARAQPRAAHPDVLRVPRCLPPLELCERGSTRQAACGQACMHACTHACARMHACTWARASDTRPSCARPHSPAPRAPDSPALKEDNIVSRAVAAGRRVLMYGDETWLKLFPSSFTRSDGTTAFFVLDTQVRVSLKRGLFVCQKRPFPILNAQVHMHARAHAHTHTHARTYAHAHTHAHTQRWWTTM